jgi:hypothetical protein
MEEPVQPDRVFGVTTIKNRCSVKDCEGEVVAAIPILDWEQVPSIWWLCLEHAASIPVMTGEKGEHAGIPIYEVLRTCRREADSAPCGAVATQVEIFGARDEYGDPYLGLTSVCDRHAEIRHEEEGER